MCTPRFDHNENAYEAIVILICSVCLNVIGIIPHLGLKTFALCFSYNIEKIFRPSDFRF